MVEEGEDFDLGEDLLVRAVSARGVWAGIRELPGRPAGAPSRWRHLGLVATETRII